MKLLKFALINCMQEKIRGQRGTLRGRWLGYVDSSKVIFSLRRKRKYVSRDVRTEFQLRILDVEIPFSFILILTLIDKLYLHAIRHYFAFTKNIRSRLALMRTTRKTDFRSRAPLQITLVQLTYPKGWTGSFPLCPLIFSCCMPSQIHLDYPDWSYRNYSCLQQRRVILFLTVNTMTRLMASQWALHLVLFWRTFSCAILKRNG